MKEKQVKFICDNCGKETGFNKEWKKDTKSFGDKHPYEYRQGWVYLKELRMKIWKMTFSFEDKPLKALIIKEIDTKFKNNHSEEFSVHDIVYKIKKHRKNDGTFLRTETYTQLPNRHDHG